MRKVQIYIEKHFKKYKKWFRVGGGIVSQLEGVFTPPRGGVKISLFQADFKWRGFQMNTSLFAIDAKA